jgi:hypothetical protein
VAEAQALIGEDQRLGCQIGETQGLLARQRVIGGQNGVGRQAGDFGAAKRWSRPRS